MKWQWDGLLGALVSLALVAAFAQGCSEDGPDDAGGNNIIETGYLSCEVNEAQCPGGAFCKTKKSAEACVELPDACAGKITCACLGAKVCGNEKCADGADGASLKCGSSAVDEDKCTPGQSFPASDGCNTCTCPDSGKKGEAPCTAMGCGEDPDKCTPGETFEADDGCNTCTCPASGKKSEAPCTEMACVYVPCAGKKCGAACTLCAPGDPDCVESAVLKACNAKGECVSDAPALLGCDMEIECTAGGENIFPEPEKACAADDECTVVFHQINCCGTEDAWGIATWWEEDFQKAEAICENQYPGCGCPTMQTTADDGKTHFEKKMFAASCIEGQCQSTVLSGCHTGADCDSMGMCFAPGESIGCGMCMEPMDTCSIDADCQTSNPTAICEQSTIADCLCSSAMICKPGCTSDAQCDEGETCDSGHHCVPTTCGAQSDCPVDFACNDGGCARATCSGDWDCTGFCVKGQCYGKLGFCSMLPP